MREVEYAGASTCAGHFTKSLLPLHSFCLPNSSKTSWTRSYEFLDTSICQTVLGELGSSDLYKGNFYLLLRNYKIDTRRATSQWHTLERIITRFITTPQLNQSQLIKLLDERIHMPASSSHAHHNNSITIPGCTQLTNFGAYKNFPESQSCSNSKTRLLPPIPRQLECEVCTSHEVHRSCRTS